MMMISTKLVGLFGQGAPIMYISCGWQELQKKLMQPKRNKITQASYLLMMTQNSFIPF